jgi:hypothetical protein
MLIALQIAGAALTAVGVGLIYTPAGIIVAGLACLVLGELLADLTDKGNGR